MRQQEWQRKQFWADMPLLQQTVWMHSRKLRENQSAAFSSGLNQHLKTHQGCISHLKEADLVTKGKFGTFTCLCFGWNKICHCWRQRRWLELTIPNKLHFADNAGELDACSSSSASSSVKFNFHCCGILPKSNVAIVAPHTWFNLLMRSHQRQFGRIFHWQQNDIAHVKVRPSRFWPTLTGRCQSRIWRKRGNMKRRRQRRPWKLKMTGREHGTLQIQLLVVTVSWRDHRRNKKYMAVLKLTQLKWKSDCQNIW